MALDLRPIDPDQPDERNLILADPPGYALHWFNGRELVTHWDTAEDHQVLAKFDANLTDMVRDMLAERPGRGLSTSEQRSKGLLPTDETAIRNGHRCASGGRRGRIG